jgi:hypothetical protein
VSGQDSSILIPKGNLSLWAAGRAVAGKPNNQAGWHLTQIDQLGRKLAISTNFV